MNTNNPAQKWPPLVKPTLKKPEPVKGKSLTRLIIMNKFQGDNKVRRADEPVHTGEKKQQSLRSRKPIQAPAGRESSSPEPRPQGRRIKSAVEEKEEEEADIDTNLSPKASKPTYEADDLDSDQDDKREDEGSPIKDDSALKDEIPNFPLLKLKGHTFPREKVIVSNNATSDDEDDELLERWAAEPVLESVRSLRSIIHPNHQITTEKYSVIEEEEEEEEEEEGEKGKEEGEGEEEEKEGEEGLNPLYNPEDPIYELEDWDKVYHPEELYHRLDHMQSIGGIDDEEGYTLEELIEDREEEDEKEGVEWALWTIAAIIVVLIAIGTVAFGVGWKPSSLLEQINQSPMRLPGLGTRQPMRPNSPRYTNINVPQNPPSRSGYETKNPPNSKVRVPPRLRAAPSNFRGSKGIVWYFFRAGGIIKETFTTTSGVTYITNKVIDKKTIWEKIKNGDLKKTALERVRNGDLNGLFRGKKRKWW
ncbi:hypothetical protein AOL_s00079g200 [Orbilia oligospora ATCC 24927]|uniref:Uncharacterized protein n=1 Tax=Arthrobotrys oligospora (strain ATCC 24927 / CBS 115.81 / DSM 1491) TaxID=756982 RepID=G1XD97_ARTOA|nr:hypothetical protein AOL_s00079g200 [Orbilia oligospora ATCC 24927]EGX48979.1 hypothetical protein AOL_s00079g200 [Orbilia oligospora ATCC 24927]